MAQSLSRSATAGADIEEPRSISETMSGRRLIPIIVGLMLGMLLSALDQTVVGTAMPRVIADLGGQNISWVYTSYLLASTVGVPIYGKLSDIYGRRIFFLAGMVVFLLGSALSGTSQDMTQLIIYRGIQGLGAGAMMPIAQAIIGDIFPPAERGKWQGLFMAVFGVATIIGPVLGGWITDNLGWRWVFYVNMPVGVVALIAAGITIPNLTVRRRHKIDFFGSGVLVLWTVPLLLAVSLGGGQFAWGSWQIIGLFVFAILMLGLFFVTELRAAEPVISPRLLRNSIFTVSVVTTFLLSAGMFGAILYLPYFVQDALGQSATNSGAVLTPLMLGFIVSSIVGGQVLSRTGKYKVMALGGFAVAAVGMFLLSGVGEHGSYLTGVLPGMLIAGVALGVATVSVSMAILTGTRDEEAGMISGLNSTGHEIGGTIGIAILSTIAAGAGVLAGPHAASG
ncbi:MAG: MDR family MFS transporter, partial [Ktedonobacterales bacterium]